MQATRAKPAVSPVLVESHIHMIRGQKVLFDADLAELYGVPTKALNQAVRRNIDRFPADFMFTLTKAELAKWKSQIVTSNLGAKMGLRKPPSVFTEQGVAMLSSVLHSKRAIQVNIAIMRAFVQLRHVMAAHTDLARKIEDLEMKYLEHDDGIQEIFRTIKQLMEPDPVQPKRRIGFAAPKGTS